MNLSDYTYLLNHPDAVNDKRTQDLDKIVHEFPFFQSARALRLKGLYNQNSFQYNYALKVAAAYTTDRSILFDFITSETFTVIEKGVYQDKQQEINTIYVKGSEVVGLAPAVIPDDKIEQSLLTSIQEAEKPYSEETATAEIDTEVTGEYLVEVPLSNEKPVNEMIEDEQEDFFAVDNSTEETITSEEIITPEETVEETADSPVNEEIYHSEPEKFEEIPVIEESHAENVISDITVTEPINEEHSEEIIEIDVAAPEPELEIIVIEEDVPEDEIVIGLETQIEDAATEEIEFIPETVEETPQPEVVMEQMVDEQEVIESQTYSDTNAETVETTEDVIEFEETEIKEEVPDAAIDPAETSITEHEFAIPDEPVLPITVYIPEPIDYTEDEIEIPIAPPVITPEEIKPVEIVPEPVEDLKVEIPIVEISNRSIEFVPFAETVIPEIGAPLEFSKDEKHSFKEWLQLSSMKPIVRDEATYSPAEDTGRKKKLTSSTVL